VRASLLFVLAGLLEIGGGYLVWIWRRRGLHVGLGVLGFLALYGLVPLLQAKTNPFGRIYAAYGAVFVVMSVLWGWWIDRHEPDLRDWLGAAICLGGMAIMMWPRAAVP